MYKHYKQTTVQVEAPSLETSKFSLYFSGSCIPINPKLSYIFTPQFLVVFNRFQCKKYRIFDEKSSYFVYILQQLSSMRRITLEIQRINSISPELCPPLTCERAYSGNEIGLLIMWYIPSLMLQVASKKKLSHTVRSGERGGQDESPSLLISRPGNIELLRNWQPRTRLFPKRAWVRDWRYWLSKLV